MQHIMLLLLALANREAALIQAEVAKLFQALSNQVVKSGLASANLFTIAHLLASEGFHSFGDKDGEYFVFLRIWGEVVVVEKSWA